MIGSRLVRVALAALAVCMLAPAAAAREDGPKVQQIAPIVPPVAPAPAGGAPATDAAGGAPAGAGNLADLESGLTDLSKPLQTLLFLSLLVFLPALLLSLTCYTRVIIVLSFVRRAIGAPELPPNPILMGLALFLTAAIMAPTFGRIHDAAIQPYQDGKLGALAALGQAEAPLKEFLLKQTREEDLALALDLAHVDRPDHAAAVPLRAAVPAFVLSELRTAFRMGFLIFLPFVLIDLVVAAVLLALGMFMLPPTLIATPLKLLLFVLVDGWSLVVRSLFLSFGT